MGHTLSFWSIMLAWFCGITGPLSVFAGICLLTEPYAPTDERIAGTVFFFLGITLLSLAVWVVQ